MEYDCDPGEQFASICATPCDAPINGHFRLPPTCGTIVGRADLQPCKQMQEGSLEEYLLELGIPREQVDTTVQAAIVWRVTPAGRPLIDRRRRSRVERNVRSVTEHLLTECGLTKGGLHSGRGQHYINPKP